MINPPEQCYCSKAELELFETPPVNVATERGDFVTYRTLATITDNGPLEFHVPGGPEEYVDLGRTRLLVKLNVLKADGTAPAAEAKMSVANLMLHSLFSQVDCKLNNKLVTPSVLTYPYKAYLETLLAHSKESKETWLQSELFYDDTPPSDAFDPTAEGAQQGLKERKNRIREGRTVELVGRPHVDIFHQEKYLLSGVDMNLKFTRSSASFVLMAEDSAAYRISHHRCCATRSQS